MTPTSPRILYVITKANFGGAQRYVYDLACAAREKGFSTSVVYGVDGKLRHMLEDRGVETVRIASLARDVSWASDLFAFFSLWWLFWRQKPDIVHLNSSKVGAIGALAGRLAGVKRIVFTAHGWASTEDRPDWQKIVIGAIHWLTVILAHITIAVSEHTKRELRRFPFAERRMVVIHNAPREVETLTKDAARREMLARVPQLAAFDIWIGTGTELHQNKGIDVAMAGFAEIASRFPQASILVIGEGEELPSLESLRKKLDLDARVFFAGFIPDASKFLPAFDIFLLPSRKEGFPYIILEAGRSGVPVVASAVGGIPEAIRDMETGILIHPKNPQEIARALGSLLSDPGRRKKLGERFKEDIGERFSFLSMAENTFALYANAKAQKEA